MGTLLDESDVSKTHEKNLESEKREMAVTGGDNHVEGKGSGNHERRENQTGKQGLENLSRGSEKGGSSWVEVAQEKKVFKKYELKIT